MSDAYECDDCRQTFSVELAAFGHADRNGHTVRYWGESQKEVEL